MIGNLNDILNHGELFYWCNNLGAIKMPGDDREHNTQHTPEELPYQARKLYETYYDAEYFDRDDMEQYVVTYRGQIGLLLRALYWEGYVGNLMDVADTESHPLQTKEMMEDAFLDIVSEHATYLETMADERCTFLLGNYTDTTGHELCLFIPFTVENRDVIRCIEFFRKNAYIPVSAYQIAVRSEYLTDELKKFIAGQPHYADEPENLLTGRFFSAQDEDHAIYQAMEHFKNKIELSPKALIALECKD